ncbi:MAG: undecaprenyl/decaprenyl-phosphate alpha-N-acetylglucosaminyl 1-phosphate transferase [Chitinophagaceae bacterium]|nr:undecaprenyl/decaprenyl-phosphate alpha-N-acetylglucosaminyl 1-phosphate transferase [Chitinophagaceae bacterium]
MFDVLLSIAISFTIAYMAIPAIITVAERKKLFDLPDERKIHKEHIPSLGGLGIFAGFMLACLLAAHPGMAPEFQYFFAAALVLFFLGLKDDILVISPIKKFIGQVIAAYLIVDKGGIQIKSMYGFFGVHELPPMFSIILTYFTVIVIINSFNLIDGIDGLAGTLGLIAAAAFGFYFVKADIIPYAVLAFALVGSLGAFLIFNFHPAKIFMGDTGSMLIGVVNSILVIKFIETAQSGETSFPVGAAPAIGFTVLLIPLMDTLRVFAIRIFKRRSPFSPDRNHIHHLMVDKGWTHITITCTLGAAGAVFVVAAYFSRQVGCTPIILSGIALFFAGIAALYYTRQPRLFVARAPEKPKEIPTGTATIVTLTKNIILEEKK